jgi:hypothetical protein
MRPNLAYRRPDANPSHAPGNCRSPRGNHQVGDARQIVTMRRLPIGSHPAPVSRVPNTMKTTRSLAIALALSGAALAQTTRTVSYAQDTLTFSSGNIVPLGSFPGNPNFQEGRWQQLIPATHLPKSQGVFRSMQFINQTYSGPIVYTSLRFTLSMVPAATTSLSTTFASNLLTPVTVLNQTNFTVNWVAGQWTQIQFDTPFAYDGQSALVFEIQKDAQLIASGIATHARDGNPGRNDLPAAVYAFGMTGSGASNAATATTSTQLLQMRLDWQRSPTMFLKSDRLIGGSANVFAISGSFDIAVDASIGSAYVTLIDGAFVPAYTIPGVIGFGVVSPTVLLPVGSVVGPGPGIQTINIPLNPFLVGVTLKLQSVAFDVGLGSNLFFTNGTDLIIRTN